MNPTLSPTDFQTLLSEVRKAMAKPIERPLRKAEAAEFLGVSLTSLDRLMRKGLPFHRLAGRPVFYASEINAWIKQNRNDRTR